MEIQDRIPFVVDFHPALSGIGKILNSVWPVLHCSDDMKRIFGERPVVSYWRPRYLKDSLVKAKLFKEIGGEKGMRKCANKRCRICDFVEEGNIFKGEHKTYRINFPFFL